jgi:hypothetical protein
VNVQTERNVRPAARINVVDSRAGCSRSGDYICRDQIDFHFVPSVLPAFFFRRPADRIVDLMRIAATVAHADRRITRRPSVCWGRDFELEIPVSDPDFWSGEPSKTLARVLRLVSGDTWAFLFRKLADEMQFPTQRELAFPTNGELTTAYSNGLDSFAGARLVASGSVKLGDGSQRQRDIVLVTTGRQINAELKQSLTPFGYGVRYVSVPFKIRRFGDGFQLREASFRTRAFVFQTMAALAAAQSEGNTVIVAESGQGSLGPWLTVTGQETPDVRTHPLFTSALADFLKLVLDRQIRFEHPQLWETKGNTLKQLVKGKLESGWQKTFSCAVQVRHQRNSGRHLHCGLCPNCLLRRQSLWAAGLDDSEDEYDYRCTPSGNATPDGSILKDLRKRIAQGLLPLIELARLRATPLLARTADRKIAAFARILQVDPQVTMRSTNALVEAHGQELSNFIKSRSPNSLVRQLAEAIS